jgi:bifunctional UDP-N-acetylglucosamine pyrophosphorylase / glucosamine-1-phosphate N-acetyltransferase
MSRRPARGRRYAHDPMADGFTVLIMAAGRGTRMRSSLPKVLHPVCGKPMLAWVVDAAREAGAARVICITRPGDGVADGLPEGVELVEQREGEGTGAAVLAARAQLEQEPGAVVVLSGDQPLIGADDVRGLVNAHAAEGAAATLLTTDQLDPTGYGRVIRNGNGGVDRVVETKRPEDATAAELAVREINLGTYAFASRALVAALDRVELVKGERYLPGAIPILAAEGGRIAAHLIADAEAALGVNDRADLMAADQAAQQRLLREHARAGVTFLQPATARIEAQVTIGADTTIGPGVTLMGATTIGAGCEVGPHSTLIDTAVADGARVIQTYAVEAEVGPGASVGPFAYLRPGASIGEQAKVGTFVEIKNSTIGAGAKVPHLSYIGDADVGEGTNLGASTITANYDGRRKHRTKVGKSVKTSVHTTLVAPVDVGDRAYTGAGSVITEDIPDGALGIARPRQTNVEGYADRAAEEKPQK